jgi:hypothetical protein
VSLGLWVDRRTGKATRQRWPEESGFWRFDEDDYLLMALLRDPIYCAELLGRDASNREYAGCYTVRDYQYPLFRTEDNYAGFTCARSVGKTESIKWRAVTHVFRRIDENLLVTAPELIHLQPLTDSIEDKLRAVRLCSEFLDTRGGKTGFTHRPFGADFADGTKIVGRIPRLNGTGVKGQHQPDLIVDEGQDYPEAGWTEVHETVLKDHVDADGEPDFTYHFYGVHTGARDSGFAKRAKGSANPDDVSFKTIRVTAIQRQGWGKAEKDAAKAAYGGTENSDYRRNILGEPGGASSPFFVTARLFACVDQDRDSRYNQNEYLFQRLRVEEFGELGLPIADVLDLPSGLKDVWGGMDLGLNQSPSVIVLFSREKVKGVDRLKLVRRIQLERFPSHILRQALYAIGYHFGTSLKGFGMDATGLGLPIWQEMGADERCPQHLRDVSKSFFFNANVEVAVDKRHVTEDEKGRKRDALGAAVEEIFDPLTGVTRLVTKRPMIEASTGYLREWVDTTYLMLPFDVEVTADMQGETMQRVKRISGLKQKPNAFHTLDAMRAMAAKLKDDEIAPELEPDAQVPVLDMAL